MLFETWMLADLIAWDVIIALFIILPTFRAKL